MKKKELNFLDSIANLLQREKEMKDRKLKEKEMRLKEEEI